jgi:aminoglycoside/choline kinase family phosphotransferase
MDDALAPAIDDLVRRRWPGSRLADLAPLAGDFSTRRYLRARVAGGAAPATVVVMALAGSGLPLSSEELGLFPEPPRELPFVDVHRLLGAAGVPVPALYVAAVDRGLLLLEDAGDVLLWDRVQAAPAEAEALYRRAIDVLLVLHVRGTAHPDRASIAFAQRFDERLWRWELEHFLEYGVERRLGRPLAAAARRGFEESFAAIAAELARAPVVLSHRDYHSWNILMRGDDPVVLDFQDALLAPAEYDLASLLTDRITPRVVDPGLEGRLLAYYWGGRGGDPRRYRLTVLHRALKVIGRVHYVALEKGKRAPLAFLPDAVATVRRQLAALAIPGGLAAELEALPWPGDAPAPGAGP